ncbi:MAG TPA: hypothetical protein VKZ97_06110 [Flavobacteriaceae bacterium]|nr:hypothetical protein [Flavobacteriaceae bacterium]
MRHIMLIIGVLIAVLTTNAMKAQQLCDATKDEVVLANQTKVFVYMQRETNEKPVFYYVPTEFNLAFSSGKPEYSFQEFNDPETGTPEAILHMLITWGISDAQLKELKQCIVEKYGSAATLAGAVYLENTGSKLNFSTQHELTKVLSKSLKSSGTPVTMSSAKMALSFHLRGGDVKKIKDAIMSPTKFKNSKMTINYTYQTNTCGGISIAKQNNLMVEGKLEKWF